jgi:thiamine biosynthesis lipoprotein
VTAGGRRAWVEQIMGMPISVHVRGPRVDGVDVGAAVAAVFAELRAVDGTFSTYRADSEISRLRRGELDLVGCSPDVREVVTLCDEARRRTGGAFDAELPGPDGRTSFDPTGLAKGWAVGRAARHLDALDGHSYCLNAGGDVVVGGDDGTAAPWRVGVERPFHPDELVAVLELSHGAVATSGRAQRGLHIVDPATGDPAFALHSVTVTGPSLLWADVLATAAYVRGAGALDLVGAEEGYEAIVVDGAGEVSHSAGYGAPAAVSPRSERCTHAPS